MADRQTAAVCRTPPSEGPTIDEIDDETLIQTYGRFTPPESEEDELMVSALAKELNRRGYIWNDGWVEANDQQVKISPGDIVDYEAPEGQYRATVVVVTGAAVTITHEGEKDTIPRSSVTDVQRR